MEKGYNERIQELKRQYTNQLQKKRDMESELDKVKQELEKVETEFPLQIKSIKEQISSTK